MRNTLIEHLVFLARENPKQVLIVGDLGFSVVEPFAEEFPDRFINAGVAEQNMTGMAAGMASEGHHVFTYSIANFPLFRCAEQLRNDVDYHNLPVTVIAVGGGLAYGNLGYSHHAVQDFSLIRAMPNMIIAAPGDPKEVKACLNYLVTNPGPSYLRINKAGEENVHIEPPKVVAGELVHVRRPTKDNKKLIVTTGATLSLATGIWDQNPAVQENWGVASVSIWGEPSRENLIRVLQSYETIVTIEEHIAAGGFGSFLSESGLRVRSFCLDVAVCGAVGNQTYLRERFGLNTTVIIRFLSEQI